MINTIRAYSGFPIVVTVPGIELVKQLNDDICKALPHREVKLLGAGSRCKFPSDDITVCSMDSLDKCDHLKVRLLLIDEVHASVTDSRLPEFLKFENARILGFGATPEGRFDGRDKIIIGLIGPVIVEKTYQEALSEGAISPLMVYFLKVPIQPGKWRRRDAAYRHLLYRSERIAGIIRKICRELIPKKWQTIIFIKEEPQAEMLKDAIEMEGTIAMAKRMPAKKAREEVMAAIKEDRIQRVIATDILAQGVTMSKLRCMINAGSGGAYTGSIQKPGRLAEIRPDILDKKYGVIFDLMFTSADPLKTHFGKDDPAGGLAHESMSRFKAYKKKGYEVVVVETYKELREHFYKTHIQPFEHLQTDVSTQD